MASEFVSDAGSAVPQSATTQNTSVQGGVRARSLRRLGRAIYRNPYRSLAAAVLLALIGTGVWLAGVHLVGWHHLRSGKAALEKYHNEKARQHLQIYLDRFPRDPDAVLLAARLARRLHAFDKADQLLNQYRRMRGEDDGLFLERILLRVEMGDLAALKTPYQDSLQKELADGDPNAFLLVEALVSGFIRSYRLADAEECLKWWRRQRPDNTQALLFQGIVHQLRSQMLDAVADYRRIVSLDPDFDDARLRLVGMLVDLNQAAAALPHLEILRQRLPENLMILIYLGRCRDQMGQEAQAIELFDQVLARQPNDALALGERGKVALRQGDLAKAEDGLRRASALAPGDRTFHYQLYLCLKQAGKRDQAKEIDLRVREIEDDLKKIQEIALWKMQQNPHDAGLHFEIGRISLAAGQEEEALRWFYSTLKEDPAHKPTHAALAVYYQRLGELGRAQDHRRQAGEQMK